MINDNSNNSNNTNNNNTNNNNNNNNNSNNNNMCSGKSMFSPTKTILDIEILLILISYLLQAQGFQFTTIEAVDCED